MTVFAKETTLYHPVSGAFTFPVGEQHPGGAWFDNPECEPPPKVSNDAELAAMKKRADEAEYSLAAQQHDLAVATAEREAATTELAGLKQAHADVLRSVSDLEAQASDLTKERDQARAYASQLEEKLGLRTAESPKPRPAIEIPADWREMKWFALKSLAAKLTDEPVKDKEAATAAVEAELARRA